MQPDPIIRWEGTHLLVGHERMRFGFFYYLLLPDGRPATAVKYSERTMDIYILDDEDSTTEMPVLWNN